ncbi:aminotransferase [Corynebacterium cystitidis]|uniref:DNA-binding transcriptional regulator, MocR family, contains an aminotransferase domain n=1 Tax=Corynebacterium cystitidis DSM 20524 TaxID=1121357 RepID=A0A1H9U8G6_9CORY|nr:aminotransferase [Corynebacterium cystitidis]WJY81221.1 Putative aminotransferase [Corynebacterium cystitidis DSM 20524]SES05538.1 DNA-binding transcriptional regulator, MocR family, contains an aminotransferase domain [Corynebacterium cystitidis DSM 20524]SNV89302.1 aspartate transaminase [Corynebacterium cystitidis]
MSLLNLDANALEELSTQIRQQYEQLKASGLKLDLTRGKPSAEQLDFSEELLNLPGAGNHTASNAEDVRNYGNVAGIVDIRAIWAELLGVPVENVYAGDSSSLNIMFDLVTWSYLFGNNDSERPWHEEDTVKWVCPVPGYDRHFTITEQLGFEMITVPMLEDGPDMDAVEKLVQDPQVKGMWTVPVFGNPTGISFSEEVTDRLAAMETAAPDFRIVWDNAYAVHTLTDEFPALYNVLEKSAAAGNPNRFWVMTSTSKITHAGSGVSFFASSEKNLKWYSSIAGVRGIGPNKVNQLAHAKFFGNAEGVRTHMRKHAGNLAPKFKAVLEILENRLGEYDVARWTSPAGGYFISLDVIDGTATRVWELARDAGITLTQAGSSFPLKDDPNDRNIRLAPSLPPQEEVEQAMDGVATCVLYAAIEKLQGK